jgi:hypothetical protein
MARKVQSAPQRGLPAATELTAKAGHSNKFYQTRQDFSGYMGLPLAH